MLNGPEDYEDILPFYQSVDGNDPELILTPYSINYLVLTNADINIKGQSNPVNIQSSPNLSGQPHDMLGVYYNGADRYLHLTCRIMNPGRYHIDLFNVTGRLIERIDEGFSHSEKFTVIHQLNSLPTGIYCIRVVCNNAEADVEKVIIY